MADAAPGGQAVRCAEVGARLLGLAAVAAVRSGRQGVAVWAGGGAAWGAEAVGSIGFLNFGFRISDFGFLRT